MVSGLNTCMSRCESMGTNPDVVVCAAPSSPNPPRRWSRGAWPKAMMRIGGFVHGRIGDMTSGELGDIAKEVTRAVLTAALFSSDAGEREETE